MKIKRVPCIPLVLHDPYFSIWSSADHLYDADPVHWCGKRQKLRGYVTIDEAVYSFLGDHEFHQVIEQKWVDVTAAATEYYFENEKIGLSVRFTSPLLLDDFKLVSRPCTYVDFKVEKKTDCEVFVDFLVSSDLVSMVQDALVGSSFTREAKEGEAAFACASMGKAFQKPLGNSGDNLTIDWGYAYLACAGGETPRYDAANRQLSVRLSFEGKEENGLILAYDDLLSINYFGQWRKAYWTKHYETILDAVGAAFADREEVLARADRLDRDLAAKAEAIGGERYVLLCSMSYRHAIAAHKLIEDDNGEILFLSKENDSNGCIGTVDVSYPSIPLFLLFNTEYVKGMMRQIFKFTASDVWEFDFAPHDVGRYPYAWGQVYGLNNKKGESFEGSDEAIFPPFCQFPKGCDIYDFRYQMPVEECGNMLVMAAVVCMLDGSPEFVKPHMEIMKQWTEYLLKYGADPGEQLCTDDFAGHLSHNANLSVKAIMGIEAYARLLEQLGMTEEAAQYHGKAGMMAENWEKRAFSGDHYMLAFGNPESWSLKYNLVWDKFFGSGLFSDEVYERELSYYVKKRNAYGTPLDSRRDYTKSDWILWCAAMAGSREQAEALIEPVADYLENTNTRVPFSDWYETVTGDYCHFIARSVQGGMFMPILMEERKKNRNIFNQQK